MKPLSVHAIGVLTNICRDPVPTSEVNPGVIDKLITEGLARVDDLPSPYKTHRGKKIPHLVVTDAGRQKIRDLEKPL